MSKLDAIIVDIDGTLSNSDHRQHFMQQKPKDWAAFYAGLSNDEPNQWCTDLMARYDETMSIILVTGRPNDFFQPTVDWLHKHYINWHALFMRNSGDFRADYIVKEEIYKTLIEPKYDVLFCVDDRQQVVDMWRRNGLVCLQCAPGNF